MGSTAGQNPPTNPQAEPVRISGVTDSTLRAICEGASGRRSALPLDDGTFLPMVWSDERWQNPPASEPSYENVNDALARSYVLNGGAF